MNDLWLAPPLAFLLILAVSWGSSVLTSFLAYRRKLTAEGLEKSYTGGELVPTHRVQPDYSQFFPFAFFFTIAHVATLMIAAAPLTNISEIALTIAYVVTVIVGLFILLGRQ